MTFLAQIGASASRLRVAARATLLIAALLAASAFMSEPAQAQPGPPPAAWLTASVLTAAPGDPVSFTAVGFNGGTTITVALIAPGPVVLGTAVAYADGIGVLTVHIPVGTALGDHTVSAKGVDPNGRALTVTVPLAVAAKVANLNVALVRTRSDLSPPIASAGLVAISVAALSLFAARKRRAHHAAA